jgi:hypothetical protein
MSKKKPAVVKKPKAVTKTEPIKIGNIYEFDDLEVTVVGLSLVHKGSFIVETDSGITYTVDATELLPYNGQKKRNEGHTDGLDWATEVLNELLNEVKYRTENQGTAYGKGYLEGIIDAIQTFENEWDHDKIMKEA